MASAAAAQMAAGDATLDTGNDVYQQQEVPVSWETTEDAIAAALKDDSSLVEEFTKRFDSELTLSPDRKLGSLDIPDDSESLNSDSPGGLGDSDTASTSSSIKDPADDALNLPPQQANSNSNGKAKTVITIGKVSPSLSLKSNQSEQNKEQSSKSVPPSTSTNTKHLPLPASSPISSEPSATKGKTPLEKNGTSNNGVGSNGSASKAVSSSTSERRKSEDVRKLSIISKAPSDSSSAKGSEEGSKSKNPLNLLRRLTKSHKSKRKREEFRSEFSEVVIDRLPQVFVAKYLGHRPVGGVCGLHHVRRPVDQMVKEVKDKLGTEPKTELPLLYVVVSPKGIDLREHKSNKVKDVAPLGLLPIDFLSYGVQDIKFWRVFTCIVVDSMSSQARTRSARCHAFLCDSAHNGRKMALALGAAFTVYSKKLRKAGRDNNFSVELRPPDELADELEQDA